MVMPEPIRPIQAFAAPARAAAWGDAAPEPYARMQLSPAARAGLAALRLFLCVITAMAAFTFLHGMHGG
jgi:hypothetical protein